MLRDEYRIKQVTKVTADTLEELAGKLEGVNANRFLETVHDYNKAVRQEVEFNATILDGRGTDGLTLPKSNWAHTIEKPPFQAYAVTCGITYTFGGVKIDTKARVQHRKGNAIPGLYAAGEMVGGLFYFNYPSGSGLVNGAVFGKLAGGEAGAYIKSVQ
jgi:tricarballylate dehydrogenase